MAILDDTRQELLKISGKENIKNQNSGWIVFPESTQQVQKIVQIANQKKLKIYVCGSQTHTASPEQIDLNLNLSRMNQVLQLARADLYVTLQAGYPLGQLNTRLAKQNLFYPLSQTGYGGTVGASVAINLTGKKSGSIFETKTYTLALEIITAYGDLIKVGAKTYKSVAGYDLTRFLTGSWGILAIITQVTLRLQPLRLAEQFAGLDLVIPRPPIILNSSTGSKVQLNRRIKAALDPNKILPTLDSQYSVESSTR